MTNLFPNFLMSLQNTLIILILIFIVVIVYFILEKRIKTQENKVNSLVELLSTLSTDIYNRNKMYDNIFTKLNGINGGQIHPNNINIKELEIKDFEKNDKINKIEVSDNEADNVDDDDDDEDYDGDDDEDVEDVEDIEDDEDVEDVEDDENGEDDEDDEDDKDDDEDKDYEDDDEAIEEIREAENVEDIKEIILKGVEYEHKELLFDNITKTNDISMFELTDIYNENNDITYGNNITTTNIGDLDINTQILTTFFSGKNHQDDLEVLDEIDEIPRTSLISEKYKESGYNIDDSNIVIDEEESNLNDLLNDVHKEPIETSSVSIINQLKHHQQQQQQIHEQDETSGLFDYKKLSLAKLKEYAFKKGIVEDLTKIKKNEILKLIEKSLILQI